MLRRMICSSLLLAVFLISSLGECRIGGGRSFGSRGSRGFATPRYQSPPRSFGQPNTNSYGNSYQYSRPVTPPPSMATPPRSSFMKSLGAGIAGGVLGSMLVRSFGGGNYGSGFAGMGPSSGVGGGGIGVLEILLITGLFFLLFKWWSNRKNATQNAGSYQDDSDASSLMRQSRPGGWASQGSQSYQSSNDPYPYGNSYTSPSDRVDSSLSSDQALDLFFRIQGAWGNRDLYPVQDIIDTDARDFLNQEISRLRAARQINRLENIAVRGSDIVEAWRDSDREFATVKYTANLLDFTVDEQTQQVVEGSKTHPVKFEEYWTFSKSPSSQWKLSAIQQS